MLGRIFELRRFDLSICAFDVGVERSHKQAYCTPTGHYFVEINIYII